jgi:hypothetical protein
MKDLHHLTLTSELGRVKPKYLKLLPLGCDSNHHLEGLTTNLHALQRGIEPDLSYCEVSGGL